MDFFTEQFGDAVPLIPDLAKEYFRNPTGSLITVRCWPWVLEDKIALLGDSSHAIVPFFGQGMNAAFEDCTILSMMIDQHGDNWKEAFEAYQQERKPNADAIADMALENYITMRDSVRDDKFQLKKEVGFELERKLPNHFIPRYSMVMFHTLPYSEAFERGKIQEKLLDEICAGKNAIEEVDIESASVLVAQRLSEIGDRS